MVRGLLKEEEVRSKPLFRDVRNMGQRIHDFYSKPRNAAIVLLVASVAVFMPIFMAFSDVILLICLIVFRFSYKQKSMLPFRMPMRSGVLDYNDLKPGSNAPNKARGICFYGNEQGTGKELWFNNDDMRTHTLIFGSTGSGKTEALISLGYNALLQGSGFIYVDGKGDNTLFAKIFSMARWLGREDDVLVVNFMTGARDIIGPQKHRLSNTLNPFSSGSSSMLSQLVISMMDSSSNTPDGDMWKGRAISFVEALMKTLVYMRDQDKILLDANTIRNYFVLDRLEAIVIDKIFPRDDQEPVNLAEADPLVLEPLYNYVINLPGYDKTRKGKQVSQVLEQHGFITMQLTRIFTSLADTYGHILRTKLAEVDLKDVVLNRRILVVLLPALEKSPDELSNLGKIIIASLRSMMAAGLGEEVEGSYQDIIARKPTNAPTPYVCILDEYGYYAVRGFAVVPAQARALGFSVVFAGQDLPAFQKASKEEAASIGANTNIKIAMKLEDPLETWEFFSKTAGEAWVMKADSFQMNPKGVMNFYSDALSASAEKRARINLLDLKDQREGEAHIFFKSIIVRAQMFYANPRPVKKMRLNQFLKVEAPPARRLMELEQRINAFSELVASKDLGLPEPEYSQDINLVAQILKEDPAPTLIERGVSALLAFHNRDLKPVSITDIEEVEVKTEELDIFSRVLLPDVTKEFISVEQLPAFSAPLLQKSQVVQEIEFSERLFGKPETQAVSVSSEIVRDMLIATKYPPVIKDRPDVSETVKLTNELSESLESMKGGSDEFNSLFDDL